MSFEDRFVELEIKTAYQEKRLVELEEVLVSQGRQIDELGDTVRLLQEALRRVRSERQASSGEAVLGALPEEDPVPRSG